jgi:ribosome-binding factor A
MSDQRRVYKVAEKIRGIISMHLHRVSDPRFEMVTITSVVVTSDLRIAKVYWTVSGGPERVAEVEEAFEHATGAIRRNVGADLGVRFVPELRFFYDETLDTVEEVNRLMERIHQNEEKN